MTASNGCDNGRYGNFTERHLNLGGSTHDVLIRESHARAICSRWRYGAGVPLWERRLCSGRPFGSTLPGRSASPFATGEAIPMDRFPEDLYAWTVALRAHSTALRRQACELCSTSVEQRLARNADAHRREGDSVDLNTVPPAISNGEVLREHARAVRSRSVELRAASAHARSVGPRVELALQAQP